MSEDDEAFASLSLQRQLLSSLSLTGVAEFIEEVTLNRL